MKKLIESIRKYPKQFIVTAVIALLIGFIVFILFYFVFSCKFTIIGALNGTGVAAALLLCVFALAWLSRNGAFDTISYGFGQMFTSMFARKANKYNNFADYREQKNTKREVASLSYFSHLFVAMLYFISFGVLEIIFHVLY